MAHLRTALRLNNGQMEDGLINIGNLLMPVLGTLK
jgi:hypothetical protein